MNVVSQKIAEDVKIVKHFGDVKGALIEGGFGLLRRTFETWEYKQKEIPKSGITAVITLDGRSMAIEAQGVNLSQLLALIDPSGPCIGFKLPWRGFPRSPQIQASDAIMLTVRVEVGDFL